MKTIKKIAKNTIIIIMGEILTTLIGIFTVIYLTRYLGAQDFGIYSFIFAYLGFFGIIVDFGIARILVRDISRELSQANKLLGSALILKFMLSILAILLSCLIINFFNYPFNIKLLVYIGALSFLFSINALYRLIFQVHLKMEYPILVEIFNSLLKLGLFFFLIVKKASLIWFVLATVIINLPALFMLMFFSRKFVKLELKIDFKVYKYLIKESWPLALTTAFIMIYTRIDQLMLFHMKGAKAVGFYAAAVRLAELFNIIPVAFTISVFPLFSNYFVNAKEKFKEAYELSFKYMSILIIPIAVVMSILSKPIINFIFGQSFTESAQAFKVLIWSEVFVFLGAIHINILIATGLQRLDFLFTVSSALLNIILNLLWIPCYNIVGAAWATLISYSLGVPLSYIIKNTRPYAKALINSLFKPMIASLIVGGFIYWAYLFGFQIGIIIIMPILLYFLIIILIRGLDKKDIEYLKTILLNKQ